MATTVCGMPRLELELRHDRGRCRLPVRVISHHDYRVYLSLQPESAGCDTLFEAVHLGDANFFRLFRALESEFVKNFGFSAWYLFEKGTTPLWEAL